MTYEKLKIKVDVKIKSLIDINADDERLLKTLKEAIPQVLKSLNDKNVFEVLICVSDRILGGIADTGVYELDIDSTLYGSCKREIFYLLKKDIVEMYSISCEIVKEEIKNEL